MFGRSYSGWGKIAKRKRFPFFDEQMIVKIGYFQEIIHLPKYYIRVQHLTTRRGAVAIRNA